jgi:hypothetical protein
MVRAPRGVSAYSRSRASSDGTTRQAVAFEQRQAARQVVRSSTGDRGDVGDAGLPQPLHYVQHRELRRPQSAGAQRGVVDVRNRPRRLAQVEAHTTEGPIVIAAHDYVHMHLSADGVKNLLIWGVPEGGVGARHSGQSTVQQINNSTIFLTPDQTTPAPRPAISSTLSLATREAQRSRARPVCELWSPRGPTRRSASPALDLTSAAITCLLV